VPAANGTDHSRCPVEALMFFEPWDWPLRKSSALSAFV
jgi:hypothetical protein